MFPDVDTFLSQQTGRPMQEVEMEFFANFDATFSRVLTETERAAAEAALTQVVKKLGG